ncbi:MT-A70-domain-containing protein [Laetiporus sulphureus 93-53]|uniref:mRNA m(6)A methyltransferase n=1 Tax=Laetiporus sulphureus 93-53 TaxID=1314785 RepID=A0A165IDG9_9APHY|nr:MT-A70-domain-containing protein [Laetiporus sulphureus 93-53]KZT12930.1 MT-A70-domain-containing protein [Laetiporus sulphureus 93-53]
MSADDRLKLVASSALLNLFSSYKVTTPISSFDLLTRVIASGPPPAGLLPGPGPPPTFRLTDLSRFETVLESLSETWEHGNISVLREARDGELMVMEVNVGEAASSAALGHGRKRKRVVDEDADSAAGDAEEEEDERLEQMRARMKPAPTTLASLSKDMKEVYNILQRSTAKGRLLAEHFRSVNSGFEPICPHITKNECAKARRLAAAATDPAAADAPATICDRVHFRPLIRPHTDPSLGHCSYLNTCYSEPTYAQSPSIPPLPSHRQTGYGAQGAATVSLPSGLGAGGRGKEKAPCRYLHFEIDWDASDGATQPESRVEVRKKVYKLPIGMGPTGKETPMLPPQWINCDLRRFDYSVLGKFHVIMADPPWDIHMSLPYGTMTDDEMRAMPIPALQDEGLLFLWVTGRAMEVGRECLRVWGYTRVDEVVWVKTNQLQRVIRTGRTGHWLNHTKEHMLVGVKTVTDEAGNLKFPSWANRGLDTDVIVSEVRETSRKPDEVYGMIERMCPGGRKIEIFGRKHNTRPGWLTLGNQLGLADQIYEEDLAARIKARYPERNVNALPMGGQ